MVNFILSNRVFCFIDSSDRYCTMYHCLFRKDSTTNKLVVFYGYRSFNVAMTSYTPLLDIMSVATLYGIQ